jgi:hypothetical protein
VVVFGNLVFKHLRGKQLTPEYKLDEVGFSYLIEVSLSVGSNAFKISFLTLEGDIETSNAYSL